jgi:(E)-4-hydroxy-3-methylbut-2-enyl-diphosphate synthase
MYERRKSRQVCVGDVLVGGDAPISVQSMLNCPAEDIRANVEQARALEAAGCEILRTAVPDAKAVRLIDALKQAVAIPIVADIHFQYKLAMECVHAGADKIRINPATLAGKTASKPLPSVARTRVSRFASVNSGSVEEEFKKNTAVDRAAMAESAMHHVALLEKHDFRDIVISIKSSDVARMVDASEAGAAQCDYPLHLGVTEAGTERMGLIKSSAGLGALLLRGIGDTVRVSMTADPITEIAAGKDILRALGLRRDAPVIVSCPTCGRTKIDLIALTEEVEKKLEHCRKNLRIAVMGCIVNGPGEAAEADIGVAGGDGCGVLFKKGKPFKKVPEGDIVSALLKEIEAMSE